MSVVASLARRDSSRHQGERRAADVTWRVLLIDKRAAAEQMAFDDQLARDAQPTLRLFGWTRPSLSTGYRQPPPEWIDAQRCAAAGIELVERPTGGGLAIHGSDLSCSVVVPHVAFGSIHELMRKVCERVTLACRALGAEVAWLDEPADSSPVTYCLAQPSSYALMAGGRKLAGLAMRRYPESWLVQGSILVGALPAPILRLMPMQVRDVFERRAISLEEATGRAMDRAALATAIAAAWQER